MFKKLVISNAEIQMIMIQVVNDSKIHAVHPNDPFPRDSPTSQPLTQWECQCRCGVRIHFILKTEWCITNQFISMSVFSVMSCLNAIDIFWIHDFCPQNLIFWGIKCKKMALNPWHLMFWWHPWNPLGVMHTNPPDMLPDAYLHPPWLRHVAVASPVSPGWVVC